MIGQRRSLANLFYELIEPRFKEYLMKVECNVNLKANLLSHTCEIQLALRRTVILTSTFKELPR